MKSHNNNINNILHMRRPSPVYENDKCGETALGPQCCRVQQISVSGCKKKIWFIVEFVQTWRTFLLVVSAGIHVLHFTEEQQQSQSSWLLIPFCFLRQSSLPWISLLSRTSFWSISLICPSKSHCVGLPLLSHMKIRLFIATLVVIEHAIVYRNSCCVRTCSLARFVAIEVLIRNHHHDRQMSSCDPRCTQLARSRAHDQPTRAQKTRRDRVEILIRDHVCDRTSLTGPSQHSSQSDVLQAHWSYVHNQGHGSARALSCSKLFMTSRAQISISR
jgi:hypothetical protein